MRVVVDERGGQAERALGAGAHADQLLALVGGCAAPVAFGAVEHGPRKALGADVAGATPLLCLVDAVVGFDIGDEVEVGGGAGRTVLPCGSLSADRGEDLLLDVHDGRRSGAGGAVGDGPDDGAVGAEALADAALILKPFAGEVYGVAVVAGGGGEGAA